MEYERDPAAIYEKSFAIVRRETPLERLPAALEPVAVRLVHACGMPEIVEELAWSGDVVGAVTDALNAGQGIFCDCEMVASGIIRAGLPGKAEVIVTLNDERVADLAHRLGTTQSAAAVSLWADRIAGAVVVIGNAPTALFQLIELIDGGWPKPAAILAFPVGFVGAAESKAELTANPRGIPFLTLNGRRGGSAMASAALNAIAAMTPDTVG